MDHDTRLGGGRSVAAGGAQTMINGGQSTQLPQQKYQQQLHQQQQLYASRDGPSYGTRIPSNQPTAINGRDGAPNNDPIYAADIATQDKRVSDILMTETGVNALLLKLKQSTHSCRDYAGYLKKIAMLTEEHASGLRKISKLSQDTVQKEEGRQGTYLAAFQNVNRINDRIADNESVFSTALLSMHEDLMELANNTERGRKHWKQVSANSEKRGPEAHQILQKVKAKYDSIAEDFERSRSGSSKSNKPFSFKSAPDDDLRRKLEMADSDYNRQVMNVNNIQSDLFKNIRPQTVRALQDLIRECDAGLALQMQRFGALNEMLLVKNATAVSPIPSDNGEIETVGMREILDGVDNEKDFRDFILGFNQKIPANVQHVDVKYEKNPAHVYALQQISQAPMQQAGPPQHVQGAPLPQSQPQPQQQQQIPQSQQLPLQSGKPPFQQPNPNIYVAPQIQQQQQQQYPPQLRSPEDYPTNTHVMGNNSSHHGGFLPRKQVASAPPNQALPDPPRRRPVFGMPLDDLLARDGNAVPTVVVQCMTAVDLFGLNVEGIYRMAGANTHVQNIKSIFDNDPSTVDFRNPEHFFHDVNSVASTLKLFFRELPDPLLTRELYPEFIEAARIDDESTRRDSLHGLINRLPDANYATIRALILHLNRVQQNSEVNKMGSQNLAICFGPTLLGATNENIKDTNSQNRVIDTILKYALEIFDED